MPSTPQRGHNRRVSSISTPGSGYISAQESLEGTPTRPSTSRTSTMSAAMGDDADQHQGYFVDQSSHSTASSSSSFNKYQTAQTSNRSNNTVRSPMFHVDSPGTAIGTGAGNLTYDVHHDYNDQDTRRTESETSLTSRAASFNSESMLEVLDSNGDHDSAEDMEFDEEDTVTMEDDEGLHIDSEARQPLVSRRRRKKWDAEGVEKEEKSLLGLIPSLVLAHALPLLPLLCLLPYNFLPAGVVFFIPIICVFTALSCCAHIVIVYLSWYLKVKSFEEVFSTVTGRYGKYGVWGGRAVVITSVTGLLVGWLGTLYPLLEPLVESYFPKNGFFTSTVLWTVLPATALLPSLLPSRMTRSLRRSPYVIVLLVPIVVFLVIGRTVEIEKATREGLPLAETRDIVKRRFGLAGGSSAGAGLTTLAVFLTPHLNTLPIHSTLARNKRASFFLPCLISSGILLALSLPFALVPYYLLPPLTDMAETATPLTRSGIFARLPVDDGWLNLARVLQCILVLGTANLVILRGRDCILSCMGITDRSGERYKVGRWVGLGLWTVVVVFACIGGLFAEKIEMLGVVATLAIGWLLPSVFFIITFHVRSPLSIIFPSHQPPPSSTPTMSSGGATHTRNNSLNDPSVDQLLVRKERQLQKRRLGRRLWQDLIVYIGILPVGCVTIAWSLGNLVGIW